MESNYVNNITHTHGKAIQALMLAHATIIATQHNCNKHGNAWRFVNLCLSMVITTKGHNQCLSISCYIYVAAALCLSIIVCQALTVLLA